MLRYLFGGNEDAGPEEETEEKQVGPAEKFSEEYLLTETGVLPALRGAVSILFRHGDSLPDNALSAMIPVLHGCHEMGEVWKTPDGKLLNEMQNTIDEVDREKELVTISGLNACGKRHLLQALDIKGLQKIVRDLRQLPSSLYSDSEVKFPMYEDSDDSGDNASQNDSPMQSAASARMVTSFDVSSTLLYKPAAGGLVPTRVSLISYIAVWDCPLDAAYSHTIKTLLDYAFDMADFLNETLNDDPDDDEDDEFGLKLRERFDDTIYIEFHYVPPRKDGADHTLHSDRDSGMAVVVATQKSQTWTLLEASQDEPSFSAAARRAISLGFQIFVVTIVPLNSSIVEIKKEFVLHHQEHHEQYQMPRLWDTHIFLDEQSALFFSTLVDTLPPSKKKRSIRDKAPEECSIRSRLTGAIENGEMHKFLFELSLIAAYKYPAEKAAAKRQGMFSMFSQANQDNQSTKSLTSEPKVDGVVMRRVTGGGGGGGDQRSILHLLYRVYFSRAYAFFCIESHLFALASFSKIGYPTGKFLSLLSSVTLDLIGRARSLVHADEFLYGLQIIIDSIFSELEHIANALTQTNIDDIDDVLTVFERALEKLQAIIQVVAQTLTEGFLLRHEKSFFELVKRANVDTALIDEAMNDIAWPGERIVNVRATESHNIEKRLVPLKVSKTAVFFQYLSSRGLDEALEAAQRLITVPPIKINPFPTIINLFAREGMKFELSRRSSPSLDSLIVNQISYLKNTAVYIAKAPVNAAEEVDIGAARDQIFGPHASISLAQPRELVKLWQMLSNVIGISREENFGELHVDVVSAFAGDAALATVLSQGIDGDGVEFSRRINLCVARLINVSYYHSAPTNDNEKVKRSMFVNEVLYHVETSASQDGVILIDLKIGNILYSAHDIATRRKDIEEDLRTIVDSPHLRYCVPGYDDDTGIVAFFSSETEAGILPCRIWYVPYVGQLANQWTIADHSLVFVSKRDALAWSEWMSMKVSSSTAESIYFLNQDIQEKISHFVSSDDLLGACKLVLLKCMINQDDLAGMEDVINFLRGPVQGFNCLITESQMLDIYHENDAGAAANRLTLSALHTHLHRFISRSAALVHSSHNCFLPGMRSLLRDLLHSLKQTPKAYSLDVRAMSMIRTIRFWVVLSKTYSSTCLYDCGEKSLKTILESS